jgi:hypothetical protein
MIGRQNPNSYAKAGNTKSRQNFQSSVNPDCKIRVFLFQATSPSPNFRFSREIAV